MAARYEALIVETSDHISTVTLNRPDSLNSLNETMTAELAKVVRQAAGDPQVRCMIITGAGRGFSSGQDLGELKNMYSKPEHVPHLGAELRRRYDPIITGLRDLQKPVLAAINGVAAGAGLSLALACDLRIASDKASFIEAFVNVGLVPDASSTFFLPRLVGLGKALELCFTGDKISAGDALAFGMVNKVVAADDLMKTTKELAGRLARLPTRAIGLMKSLLYRSFASNLETQLEAEALAQETAGLSADHREGVLAFLQKRPANFRGQ